MKKMLLIYMLVAVGLLTSCDYHKRECVAKAARCLTDESYKDYLSADKDSLVDSVYSILREQRLMLQELRNGMKSGGTALESAKMAQIVETKQYADVVQNIEEMDSSALDAPNAEIAPSEGNGWGKKLAMGGAALGAVAAGAVIANKVSCPRMDVVIEYQLMRACVNSCGESMVEKCGTSIMAWICKNKEDVEKIRSRVSNSCSIR